MRLLLTLFRFLFRMTKAKALVVLFLVVVLAVTFPHSIVVAESGHKGNVEKSLDVFCRDRILAADDAFTRGDKSGAIALLHIVVNRCPQSSVAHFLLGTYLLARDAYDKSGKVLNPMKAQEALVHIKTAVELSPNTVSYQFSYAVLLGELGRDTEVVAIWDRYWASEAAFRSHPRYRYFVINYADSLARLGQRERALKELQTSVEATNGDWEIVAEYERHKKRNMEKRERN